MNVGINEIRRQVGYGDEGGYWRARSVIGSRLLLIRLKAEHDANMRLPEGWKKPKPKPVNVPPPLVYPVIPEEDTLLTTVTPSVRRIQEIVAKHYGISRQHLIGPRRTKYLMTPRHVAAYLARELTNFSTPQLGRFFGKKDHTVILNSEKRIREALPKDEQLAFDVAYLFERITGVQQ